MRVIAGELRSRTILAPDTTATRPTTDRARESLFNVLTNLLDFEGLSVLDCYAGSGALGIEALSRGAKHVTFVEKARKPLLTIMQNLGALGLESKSDVLAMDVLSFVRSQNNTFDLIFLDPPYENEAAYSDVLQTISERMSIDSITAIEHRTQRTIIWPENLDPFRKIIIGESVFTLFRIKSSEISA